MTDIKKKARALLNEVRAERGLPAQHGLPLYSNPFSEALCRAIEQHEAFRQEVSDTVEAEIKNYEGLSFPRLSRFIIAKPDPLVEALKQLNMSYVDAEDFRQALAKRGGKIVWEND